MDLGQNVTLRLFYPRITIYLQKVDWVTDAVLQFRQIQAGEETLVPQQYNMMRSETFFFESMTQKKGSSSLHPPFIFEAEHLAKAAWPSGDSVLINPHILTKGVLPKCQHRFVLCTQDIQVTACLSFPSYRASLVLHAWHQIQRKMILRGQAEISASDN